MVSADIKLARAKNLRFRVAQRKAKEAAWETVEAELADLGEAISLAQSLATQAVYEAAVFVLNSSSDVIYWSSSSPNGYNSAVLM